ncbi:hypothetical protein HNY73_023054 [Argiope bruennichi]|uniref:Uncharacterized protein n=1 Tax=Argiope bruennichi TaxID=94029 RepID=A0A8T0E469_ARGBR|nr:hypothetical protein HNY73_023054 [Argiope bruennichi]
MPKAKNSKSRRTDSSRQNPEVNMESTYMFPSGRRTEEGRRIWVPCIYHSTSTRPSTPPSTDGRRRGRDEEEQQHLRPEQGPSHGRVEEEVRIAMCNIFSAIEDLIKLGAAFRSKCSNLGIKTLPHHRYPFELSQKTFMDQIRAIFEEGRKCVDEACAEKDRLQAENERLKAENERLKEVNGRSIPVLRPVSPQFPEESEVIPRMKRRKAKPVADDPIAANAAYEYNISRDCVRRELAQHARGYRVSKKAVETVTREAEEWLVQLHYLSSVAMKHRKGRRLIQSDFKAGMRTLGLDLLPQFERCFASESEPRRNSSRASPRRSPRLVTPRRSPRLASPR